MNGPVVQRSSRNAISERATPVQLWSRNTRRHPAFSQLFDGHAKSSMRTSEKTNSVHIRRGTPFVTGTRFQKRLSPLLMTARMRFLARPFILSLPRSGGCGCGGGFRNPEKGGGKALKAIQIAAGATGYKSSSCQ
ncbi:hypothetical protein AVEN_267824-1 [Araneus ventricosus]|uniref:Uncharacterized protein n=1 Tax=Araneus ventricosus TaxID=182803 RepID=A0A4Y2D579_ARAVE|nr:hypothetical protein AVEN_267824-1 [Araneus ventricosus]